MGIVRVGQVARALVVAALAVTSVAGVNGGSASAAAACQRTFTSSASALITPTLSMPGPDGFPIVLPGRGSSTLDVPDGVIADVDLTVHITHPDAEALALSVRSGGGLEIFLKAASGPAGADFAGTTFDDEATQGLLASAPPFSGSFRPVEPLSGYDGTAAGGTWTLSISNASGDPGTIDSWSVTVTYAGTCDEDGDAVEDHVDQCPGLSGRTASGCPLASSAVTAKYRHGVFKGLLSSSAAPCRAPRAVTVWKMRTGPDRKVGTRITPSDGGYQLKRTRHRGKYYATAARTVVPGVAECPAVTSPTFRLR